MSEFHNLSIKVSHFKCFGESLEGFDRITRFNVIIGQNNTGKTTLLDMLQYFTIPETLLVAPHRNYVESSIVLGLPHGQNYKNVQAEVYRQMEREALLDQGNSENSIYQKLTRDKSKFGESAFWLASRRRKYSLIIEQDMLASNYQILRNSLEQSFSPSIEKYKQFRYFRISAERNIVAEEVNFSKANRKELSIDDLQPNGANATTILTYMLNRHDREKINLVKEVLLGELNKICSPRMNYVDISALQNEESGDFEVLLKEKDGTLIPLSKMGSGIKTIILVLMTLYCVPFIGGVDPRRCFFLFEELENNLHPALQRKLFSYLRKFADEKYCHFAITTHSHVAIDMFSHDKGVQFLHVVHDGQKAEVIPISTYAQNCAVFDDLDIRASDLLQSNCIIWVEGPSDRIYLKHWIKLVDSELNEHVDFTFAFSSGTLLSHLTYDPPSEAERDSENRRIQALRINRNVIVVMDRDKMESSSLKGRVERVIAEVVKIEGHHWVTQHKEIENFMPPDLLLSAVFPDVEPSTKSAWTLPGPKDNVIEFITTKKNRKSAVSKTEIAELVCESWTKDILENDKILHGEILRICEKIREYNRRQLEIAD